MKKLIMVILFCLPLCLHSQKNTDDLNLANKILKIDEENKTVEAFMDPEQVSKAIGRGGHNIRLAGQLTGYEIDVYREGAEEDVELTEFSDEIEGWVLEEFKKAGLDTAKSVLEQDVEDLIKRLGSVEKAFVIGDYARGIDSGLIDVVLVGNVDVDTLEKFVYKTGKLIDRKIRPLVLDEVEFQKLKVRLDIDHALPIWNKAEDKIQRKLIY